MARLGIPVGISDFEKIRKNGYYYVDKSGLIAELLEEKSTEVTLITRPRRFGKTLGMSMLANFFDIRKESTELFKGLEIAEQRDVCSEWMNQFPTLFVTFKDVDGLDFSIHDGRHRPCRILCPAGSPSCVPVPCTDPLC